MRSFFKIKLIRFSKYLTNSSILFFGEINLALYTSLTPQDFFFSRNHPLCCETWETFGLDLKTWWETEYLTFRWDDLGFHLAASTESTVPAHKGIHELWLNIDTTTSLRFGLLKKISVEEWSIFLLKSGQNQESSSLKNLTWLTRSLILTTDNSLPVLLSSWNYDDKYAKY